MIRNYFDTKLPPLLDNKFAEYSRVPCNHMVTYDMNSIMPKSFSAPILLLDIILSGSLERN